MISLQVVEDQNPRAQAAPSAILTPICKGVPHEGSTYVPLQVPPLVHQIRFNPPFQLQWSRRARRHSPVTRQCIRPNLLAWDGEKYAFCGRAPSRSDLATPSDLAHLDDTIPIRCGHCINCRIRRAIEWKIRGIHEAASTFHPTYAVTLTYDQEHIDPSGSLRKSDLQSFHRRLRYNTGFEFRFLACGEYGPNTGRAHYHGVYFGLRLPDVYKSGHHLVSPTLRDAWGNGQITFHLATPQSIAYVSGYVVKKLRSQHRTEPVMETVDVNSGLVVQEEHVRREFLQASNRPGIGSAWVDQYGDQVLANGFIIIKEKPCYVIPDFYIKKLRDRPGFPAFQEKRLEHMSETPVLSPEELSAMGLQIEGDLARRQRAGV